MAGNRGRVENMSKIDRQDRKYHNPGRQMLVEKVDADKLAGPGINDGAHQRCFRDAHAMLHGHRSEKHAEGRGRDNDGRDAPQPGLEVFNEHTATLLERVLKTTHPTRVQVNSLDDRSKFFERLEIRFELGGLEREAEDAAARGPGLAPDATAMTLDNLATDRQPQPRPFDLRLPVQAPEWLEDPLHL